MDREEAAGSPSSVRERGGDALVHSFPLVLSAVALLVGGYVTWSDAPTAGPPIFPLWVLLVILGFVAAAGAIVSFVVSDGRSPEDRADPSVDARRPPSAPRADFGRPRPEATPAPVPTPSGGLAVAMAPFASRPASPADWSEDELPLPAPRPLARPLAPIAPVILAPRPSARPSIREAPATATPRPSVRPPEPVTPPPSPASTAQSRAAIESALAELDEIQRDTSPRRAGGRVASP